MKKLSGKANSNLYKRGDVIWVRYTKDGRQLQKSLDTENLTDARMKRDVEISAFMNSKEPSWKGKKLTAEYFEDWLIIKKQKAENTHKSMSIQWRLHLQPFFGHLPVADITESLWMKYVEEKRAVKPARKFFNDRKYLSMFLNWCLRESYIDKKPHIPDVDPEIEEGRALSDEEVGNLLLHAAADLELQLLMGLTMGMRKWEILNLEWTQIDFIKGEIFLPAHKTKTRKARRFPISDATVWALKNRALNSKSPFVFPNPHDPSRSVGRDGNQSAWLRCRELAGIPDCHFHWTRHTFLTRAFKTATAPALICAYAGLSMEVAQRVYLHFKAADMHAVKSIVSF